MADVRSLLRNERATRRIQHVHAAYTASGVLKCIACNVQLKSEALWEPHLKSAGHIMQLQKARDASDGAPTPPWQAEDANGGVGNKKKRKASDEEDTIRKRSRGDKAFPGEAFDDSPPEEAPTPPAAVSEPPTSRSEMQIPSRPATPSKPVAETPWKQRPSVDEDEWAAFEADIAAAEEAQIPAAEAVISAPAISAAELKAQSVEEANTRRRERQEAELEGDKEDAARKLEDEFEEMEGLEERVRRLREKREALRMKERDHGGADPPATNTREDDAEPTDEDDDDDDEDDDDWDGFRLKA